MRSRQHGTHKAAAPQKRLHAALHTQRHHRQRRERTFNGANAVSAHTIPSSFTCRHRRCKSMQLAQPQLRSPTAPRREQPLEPSPLNQGDAGDQCTSRVAAAPASPALHGAAPMAQIRCAPCTVCTTVFIVAECACDCSCRHQPHNHVLPGRHARRRDLDAERGSAMTSMQRETRS